MQLPPEMAKRYREVFDRYCRVHEVTEACVADVVRWGLTVREFYTNPSDEAQLHHERLIAALRQDKRKDGQGRTVRLRHCARVPRQNGEGEVVQRHLWAHMDDATDEFMVAALTERLAMVRKHYTRFMIDADYYNDLRQQRGLRPIQWELGFNTPSDDLDDEDVEDDLSF